MLFQISPPPVVPLELVQKHLDRAYGLKGKFTSISAERDQNFRIETGSSNYLLKVCATAEGFALAEAQAMALRHIAAVSPALPVPRVVTAKSGNAVTALPFEDIDYPVMLLDWLPGDVLGPEVSKHLSELASLLAQLGKALRGFTHASLVDRRLFWNVARADELASQVHLLGKPWDARARTLLSSFATEVKPKLRGLRAQTIHADVHPYNVLHHEGRISGIIDFGDMIHGPLIADLADTMADCLHGPIDRPATIETLVSHYHAKLPLEREEIDVLLPLVNARLISGTIISLMRKEAGLGLTLSIEELCAESLETLDALESAEQILTEACYAGAGYARRQGIQGANIMERRIAAMGPKPLLFYSKPLHVLKGQGVWLHADDGRAYLDCYNNVAHVGHAHPAVAEAVGRQLHILNTNTRYITDESIQYAEALKATLDPSLNTVVFVNSGSEAVDVAWRMAKLATGHSGALCMDFAYHGVTTISDAVSPSNYPEGKWNVPFVRQLEAPDTYRGPYGSDHPEVGEAYAALADAPIADLQYKGFGLALAILDSAFMTNGILDAPAGYVKGVVERTRRAGGLFVADEVQSGFGRMGSHMWGHQRHGVIPDFVTIGKPAGNGYPVGVIITRAEILERFVFETGPFFSTFGGGNAACVAGLTVLDVMRREGLVENAEMTGKLFRDHLRDLMQQYEIIGDVRGAGFAIGVELVKDRKSKTPARAETKRVLDLMRDRGVLIGSDGKHGNVLKIRPPLVLKPEHAERAASALASSLSKL